MAGPRLIVVPVGFPIKNIDGIAISRDLQRLMRNTVAEGNRFIAKYPPQRLRKSGYKRTGTLKRSWSFKVRNEVRRIVGTVGSNSNIAPYNRFVQGRRQRRLFRGAGWRNVNTLEARMTRQLITGADAIMERAVR